MSSSSSTTWTPPGKRPHSSPSTTPAGTHKRVKSSEDDASSSELETFTVRPTLLRTKYDKWRGSRSILALDLNDTMIETHGTTYYPLDSDDWLWREGVKSKVRKYHSKGYSIVIFSNCYMAQPAYRTKYEDQLAQVLRDLNVPLLAYTAMAKDEYCKPAIGMWQYFTTKDNKFDIDRTKSVFVGDAAGRTFTFASRGPDFDVYDREFATNVGLEFQAPEEFFEGAETENWANTRWDPKSYDHDTWLFAPSSTPLVPKLRSEWDSVVPDVVLLVGMPACGKTHSYEQWLKPKGYLHVTADSTNNLGGRISDIAKALSKEGGRAPESVAVEDDFATKESRALYVKALRDKYDRNISIRIFHFVAPWPIIKQNSLYRALFEQDKGKTAVDLVTFEAYYKRVEEPILDDEKGVDELKRINFIFDGTPEQLEHWQMHLDPYMRGKRKSVMDEDLEFNIARVQTLSFGP